ncbi:polysaccharide biosynthesis protein [Shewanella violacea]|nr:polysaccharide biosynthesis protein [Shewanella violacea]
MYHAAAYKHVPIVEYNEVEGGGSVTMFLVPITLHLQQSKRK